MRAVVQRVSAARVEVDGETVGQIGAGLCVFVAAGRDDEERDLEYVADKIVGLRVFVDGDDKMNLSVADVGGQVLAVSQFTLYGDLRRGRRPGFGAAMAPAEAEGYYDALVARVRQRGVAVETGRFGAKMRVLVDNDGPVTILIDSRKLF